MKFFSLQKHTIHIWKTHPAEVEIFLYWENFLLLMSSKVTLLWCKVENLRLPRGGNLHRNEFKTFILQQSALSVRATFKSNGHRACQHSVYRDWICNQLTFKTWKCGTSQNLLSLLSCPTCEGREGWPDLHISPG